MKPSKNEPPRLVTLVEAARYLNCSYWTVRDWCLSGRLPKVVLPALRPRPGERPRTALRRVLIDRADLDTLIQQAKRCDERGGC